MTTLYEQIGADKIQAVLTRFYDRAFEDLMISHFFLGKDKQHLIEQQVAFVTGILGGPRIYRGKPLRIVHQDMAIRPPHFGRRQVIMREVLDEMQVEKSLADNWLKLEEEFRPVIQKAR